MKVHFAMRTISGLLNPFVTVGNLQLLFLIGFSLLPEENKFPG